MSSVLEAKDGDSHFAAMDIGWAQELFGLQGKLTGVLFQISDPNNPEPVCERIRHLVPPDAVVQEPGARSGQVEHLLSGFELNLTALSMISLLVGVFLIYNTVTASVVRRRSEVGILRALGASRAKVRWLFLGEAALYGMIGSVAGCVGGVLLSNFLVRAVSKTVTNLYVLTSIDHFYLPFWQIPAGAVGRHGIGPGRCVYTGQCRRQPAALTRLEHGSSYRAKRETKAVLVRAERWVSTGGIWR